MPANRVDSIVCLADMVLVTKPPRVMTRVYSWLDEAVLHVFKLVHLV